MTDQQLHTRLPIALLLLRLSVFIVMIMWTIDKFLHPGHAVSIFERYYQISGLGHVTAYLIGVIQLGVILAFVSGFKKRISYGLVLLMHLGSTVSSWHKYINPWDVPNLLFFAAFPMLAAIFALYLLRDQDTLLALDKTKPRTVAVA
ncbi:Uncharacterised protein [BD1-7 clade bacterium]|uniref:DoxX family protein n=1 Tax=BD1-7 clade bacterium TaxID=2029982 RepID=A0A5S9QWC0_9GAMM|nr:Uncharacterised protein [BD1-7 clade bacterium]CAA0122922.1 Uncharacterised protein [BD1-7 clade bacterium]